MMLMVGKRSHVLEETHAHRPLYQVERSAVEIRKRVVSEMSLSSFHYYFYFGF